MAKQNVQKEMKLDDGLDLDKELDSFDDFDFDVEEPKDDRNPATKVAQGVLQGAKDTLTDTDFIARTLKQTLPKNYGKAFDMANTVSGGLKDLYNTTATELKPVINDLKKTTGKLLPMFEGAMPKTVSEKLSGWANSTKKDERTSGEDMKEAAIGAALGDIFGAQEQGENQREASRVAREEIRDASEKKRAKTEFEQLNAIRMGVAQITAYQEKVTTKVQRKSLELQYRTFFAISEMLEETKRSNAASESELKLISKNSALPDYSKLQLLENFGEVMRNEFIGSIHDGLFGGRRQFFTNLTKNIVKRGKDKVRDFRSSFEGALSGIDAAAEGINQAKEMGMDIDPLSMGAEMAGQSMVEKAGAWGGKKLRGILEKNDGVRTFGNKIANVASSDAQILKEWADGYSGDNIPVVGGFVRFLKDAIGGSFSNGKSVKQDVLEDVQKPAVFTGRVSRSITDIIPGFLSRIFRELQVIRTGDASLDLTLYDHGSGKFIDTKEHATNIAKTFFNESNRYGMDREIETVMKLLDPDGTKLSPEDRKKLGLKILQDNIDNKHFSKERLTDDMEYGDFAEIFKSFIGEDKDHSKRGEIMRAMNEVGTSAQIDYAKLQTLVNAGYGDILKSLGLIGDGGNIRDRAILEAYLKGDPKATGDYLKDQRMNSFGTGRKPTAGRKKYNYRTVDGKQQPVEETPKVDPVYSDSDFDEYMTGPANGRAAGRTDALNEISGYLPFSDASTIDYGVAGTSLVPYGRGGVGQYRGPSGRRPPEDFIEGEFSRIDPNVKLLEGPAPEQSKRRKYVTELIEKMMSDVEAKDITNDVGEDGKSKLFDAAKKYLFTTADVIKGKYKQAKDYVEDYANSDKKVAGQPTTQTGDYGDGSYVDRIIAAIEAQSVKEETGSILDILQSMLQVIGTGVRTFSTDGSDIEDMLPWYKMTVGGALGRIGRSGKNAVSSFFKGIGKAKNFAMRQVDKVVGFGKKAFDFATPQIKEAWGWARDKAKTKYEELRDIYIEGEYKPRLKAELLKAGEYVDAQTGKVIEKFSDITGEVRDKAGNVILSAEEAGKAYIEKARKRFPLRKWATQIGDTAVKSGKFIFDKASKLLGGIPYFNLAKGVWDAGGAMFKSVAGVFKGFTGKLFGEGGLIVAGSKKIVTELEAIRMLLDERLPKRKKVTGDSDGDGDRDGSYEDIIKEREAEAKEAKEETASAAGGAGAKGFGVLGALKGLFDKKGEEDGEEGESWYDKLGVDFDLPFGGSDEDKAKRARRRAAKKRLAKRKGGKLLDRAKGKLGKGLDRAKKLEGGRMGRLANSVKGKVGELATRKGVTGALARAAGGIGRGAATVAGKVGGGVLGGIGRLGLGLGSAALQMGAGTLAGIGSAASMLGSVTMSALGGAAGLLASPVVLGALAVGAVGYGAYKLYNGATRNKMSEFDKLRYAQYGLNPSDPSKYHLIKKLEEATVKVTSFNDGGAGMDESNLQVKEIAEEFGVDLENNAQIEAFINWFRNRFKPVFLTTMTALNNVKRGIKLEDVESLPPAEQKKFLQQARFSEGPYNYMVSPFPDLPKLTADGNVVKSIATNLQSVVDAAALKQSGKAAPAATPVEKAKVAAVATAGMAAAASGVPKPPVAKPAASVTAQPTTLTTPANIGATVGMAVISVAIPNAEAAPLGAKMDAVTAVRMKAYGLVLMDADKVSALRTLEKEVQRNVSFSKDGRADWKGSIDATALAMAGHFGVDINVPEQRTIWVRWFQQRFVPVYLTYAGKVNSLSGKPDPAIGMLSIKPAQELEVAKAISGTKNSDGVPPWAVVFSPWAGYKLNTSASSASENISAILGRMATSTHSQEVGKGDLNSAENKEKLAKAATGAGAKKEMSMMESAMAGVSGMWDSTKKAAAAAGAGVVSGVKAAGAAVSEAASSVANTVGGWFGGGNDVSHPGKGTGGDINALPAPRGDGSYLAYKDMIDAASKMAGVDPRLMGIMAAIESSFKNKNLPGTSSAKGLYQFIDGTWATMLKKYGRKYGLSPKASPLDPRANTLMAAEFIKENIQTIKSAKPGGSVSDTDVYLAHFLGGTGYRKFIRTDPNAVAAAAMPKEAAANKGIFYNKAQQPYTVGQIYQNMNNLLSTRAKQFKINAVQGVALPAASTIPVSAPGAAAKAVTPVATPAANVKAVAPLTPVANGKVNTPKPSTPAPVSPAAAAAAVTGVSVPQAASMQRSAQQAANATNNGIDIAPITNVLERSYDVQKKSLDQFEQMVKTLNNMLTAMKKSNPSEKATGKTIPVAAATTPTRAPAALPGAPVPMEKPSYGT